MTIKIMYLVDQYQGPQAGTEGQLLQLLLHLDRSRYEPSLTLLRDTEYSRRNAFPCPVRVLGITKLASLRAIIGMFRYAFMLRRENYRLVHCFFNDSALIAPFFLWLFGIRVLVSRRDMGFWYTPGNLVVLRVVALDLEHERHVVLVPGHALDGLVLRLPRRVAVDGCGRLRPVWSRPGRVPLNR